MDCARKEHSTANIKGQPVSAAPCPAALSSEVLQIFNHFFFKLLVAVLGLVSVEKLVRVEDAPPTRFARYRRKTNILT